MSATPFLRQVARHYFLEGDISRRCFIFPNRRSLAFFMEVLAQEVKHSGTPIAAPQTYTINDFFCRASGMDLSGRTTLLLELYQCYSDCCQSVGQTPDLLDDFIFWGDVLISDFNDVDKYNVDAKTIFTNLSEFRNMDNGFAWIEDEVQRRAVEALAGHFMGGQIADDSAKGRFRRLWDMMYPMYKAFNERLQGKGMAYEGMIYRSLVHKMDTQPAVDVLEERFRQCRDFVFVGLNALNGCEKKVMSAMRKAGLAQFCWDFSSDMIRDKSNQASKFISENRAAYPDAFRIDPEGLGNPDIEVISVPSSVGQTSVAGSILEKIASDSKGTSEEVDWLKTAVVLPEENLLLPLLNSIPENIQDINVTMGYPMSGSSFFALMSQVATLQLHMRQVKGDWCFYHRQVRSILSNEIFKSVCSDEDAIARILQDAKYYIPAGDFSGNPLMEAVFTPIIMDMKSSDRTTEFGNYLKDLCLKFATGLKNFPERELELSFAKEYWTALQQLCERIPPILPATFVRLLRQLLGGVSVPFSGEPLKGLQLMGPLETRALDFDNVIILSVNEDVFPRRSVGSSFIPPELRTGFGLPTYEHQDRVWAYYFYRLIQRAKKVWLIYDSRTSGLKSGDESRYIKQLEYQYAGQFHLNMKRYDAVAGINIISHDEIEKTAEDVEIIRKKGLSASSIENYLYCPVLFYYQKVKDLKAEEEIAESLDGSKIGTIFHKTIQNIFEEGGGYVSKAYLDSWRKRTGDISDMVSSLIQESVKSPQVSGRDLVTRSLIERYVKETLRADIEFLKEKGSDGFEVLGLEKTGTWSCGGFPFFGYIDRIDSYRDGQVRVVDYKTGSVLEVEIQVKDQKSLDNLVSSLFEGDTNRKRPKIALQMFLYDRFMENLCFGGNIENYVYHIPSLIGKSPVPMLDSSVAEAFTKTIQSNLEKVLAEIASTQVPFRHTQDKKTCKCCDFKNLCGR